MYYRLELVVEPWASKYYKSELTRSDDNAGYDLFCHQIQIPGYSSQTTFVNMGVRARMLRITGQLPYSQGHYINATTTYTEEEVHYRLVPRSSICKTPLLMANSEGIIDKSYRGLIQAPVRNFQQTTSHEITEGTRLFQIVAPDLGHIREIVIVHALPETRRGEGGFGSTGL